MDAGKSRDRTQSLRIPGSDETGKGRNLGSSTWYGPTPYKEPAAAVTIRRQTKKEVSLARHPCLVIGRSLQVKSKGNLVNFTLR